MTEKLSRVQPVDVAWKDGKPKLTHPSEQEFAQILGFYGLRLEYEPRSFPLRWDDEKTRYSRCSLLISTCQTLTCTSNSPR